MKKISFVFLIGVIFFNIVLLNAYDNNHDNKDKIIKKMGEWKVIDNVSTCDCSVDSDEPDCICIVHIER